MAVRAMACGACGLYAVAQGGKQHRRLVCEDLGIRRLTTASHPQLHSIFAGLEATAFEAVLGRWRGEGGLKRGQGTAVDGKTLRSIHEEQLPVVHLISACAHQKGVVLAQCAAPGAGQELEAVKAALESLDLKGQVVTGDALLL